MILLGVLLIVSVLYLPNGLAGHDWRGLWQRISRRKQPPEQAAEQRHE
jgi:hypothetical protein